MRTRRIGLWAGLSLALCILVLAVATGISVAAAGQQESVALVDYEFRPSDLIVPVGATVVWTNTTTSTLHTVTADDASFDSGNLDPGGSFSMVFNTPGTYRYHCVYHESIGMVGSIVVTNLSPRAYLPTIIQQ